MPLKDSLPLISGALGFIAIACILSIGGYVIAWCWNIYSSGLGPSFLTVAIISWILTLASASLLVYGSLTTIRRSTRRGGLINLAACIITIPLFIYFYSYLPLLPQFGPVGFLLFLPAMLSGIISLAS